MSHEEYKEMLAEHALGALEPGKARSLEEHLATCAECRTEFARWRDTASSLAYTVAPVEPPVALRSRLMESVRAQKSAALPSSARQSEMVEQATKPEPSIQSNVIQFQERTRSHFTTAQRLTAIAASLAFVAVIISLLVLWNRNREMQSEMARISKDLQTTQERLRREQEKSLMLTAPDTRIAELNGTEMAPSAHARLAYNPSGSAMMIIEGLPPAPAGKDYQIWFIAGGKPMPGGVFKPDAAGHVEMHDRVPPEAQAAAAFAVTLEPQGGTTAPTGEKYLLGTAAS